MEEIKYVERKNSNCNKWDAQTGMFGEENLHAMWVADMDFRVPQCVIAALENYVQFGVYGYYKIPQEYYTAFINWEKVHHGFEVKKEWMRFSPGVVAGFHWLVQMLSEPGDAVIVNTPVYYPFLNAVKNNERKLICSDLICEDGEEWLAGVKTQIYDNYLYLKKELSEKLSKAIVTPLEGTYLCWVDLNAYVSEENIKDVIQKKCRLAVDYGDWFGGEQFGTHIRINLATSLENVKIAVDALVDNL